MNKIFLTLFILTSVSQAISLNGESIYENERASQFVYTLKIENECKLFLKDCHLIVSHLFVIKKGGIVALAPSSRFESSITVGDNGRIIDENLDMILTSLSPEDDWKRWLGFYKLTH